MASEAWTDCETCGATGRVEIANKWSVDKGTKWQRSFEEQVEVECPTCNGDGYTVGMEVLRYGE